MILPLITQVLPNTRVLLVAEILQSTAPLSTLHSWVSVRRMRLVCPKTPDYLDIPNNSHGTIIMANCNPLWIKVNKPQLIGSFIPRHYSTPTAWVHDLWLVCGNCYLKFSF